MVGSVVLALAVLVEPKAGILAYCVRGKDGHEMNLQIDYCIFFIRKCFSCLLKCIEHSQCV